MMLNSLMDHRAPRFMDPLLPLQTPPDSQDVLIAMWCCFAVYAKPLDGP